MAEFKVFLTNQDFEDIVFFIFELGGKVIPDLNYDRPEYVVIDRFNDFHRLRSDAKLLFIVHGDWFDEPLEMKSFEEKSGQTGYFIAQKSGGPTIDIFLNGEFRKGCHRYVGSGFIGYHSKYWSSAYGDYRPQPENLKCFYRSLVKQTKNGGSKRKGQRFVYRAGQRADEELESGNLKIAVDF